MEKIKQNIIKIFSPPTSLLLCMIIFCTVSLIFIFSQNKEDPVFSCIIYSISAYSLTSICFKIPKIYRFLYNLAQSNPLSQKYITDYLFRFQVSLYLSFGVNLVYATFKLIVGLFFSSHWWVSIAAYYMVLAVARLLLVRYVHSHTHNRNLKDEFIRYRMCGFMLFIINIAFMGIVMQMIWQDKGYHYPGFLIYFVAAYTFYCITISIFNLIRYRKLENPVLTAAKAISLVNALSSLIALETALFSQFGKNAQFKELMIETTGFIVCIFIFILAFFMVLKGNIMLKKLNKADKKVNL